MVAARDKKTRKPRKYDCDMRVEETRKSTLNSTDVRIGKLTTWDRSGEGNFSLLR